MDVSFAAKLYIPTICPCCGRYIFDEKGGYEICPVCGWEDDPVQRRDETFAGGANREPLTEARKKWNDRYV